MTSALTWRALERADSAAVAALVTLASAHDGTPEVRSTESVEEVFDQPRFDAAAQSVSAWSGEDLIAFGLARPSEEPVEGRALVMIPGTVHPQARDAGVGTHLLGELERRAGALAAERLPDLPVRLRSAGGLEGSASERLLVDAGYRPDNYFVTMQVELASWADPGGETAAVAPDEAQIAATRDAHNDAFRDHRNASPIPADVWAAWQSSSLTRPESARVIVQDGRVLAYAMADESEPGVLHTGILGTRREARGRGLGRQLLLATLRGAREAGYRIAELEVDTTSPTGADRLYEAVGYRPVRVISRYIRDVPDA